MFARGTAHSMADHITRPEVVTIIVKTALIGLISYFGLKWTIEAMDPTRKQKQDAKEKVRRFEIPILIYVMISNLLPSG